MPLIDPTTDIGRLRLRVGDFQDLVLFPDSVYESVLADNNGNLKATAKAMATYILGLLSQRTHRRLNQLEVWGGESFRQYKEFLLLTIKDPAFMDISPIPYFVSAEFSPILQFQSDWNKNFYDGTESQSLAITAEISPNDGSKDGPFNDPLNGWTLV